MKQTAAFILLGSIAVGISAALHEKLKARKHKPAATLRDLYEDNASSELRDLYEDNASFEPFIFDDSPVLPGFGSLSPHECSLIDYQIANTPLFELL